MADDTPRTHLTYQEALHAMQSGVAYEMNKDLKITDPKHLRVGINSAMVNDAALVRLLIKKGLFTLEEYEEELRLEACREVDRYETRLSLKYNRPLGEITLR